MTAARDLETATGASGSAPFCLKSVRHRYPQRDACVRIEDFEERGNPVSKAEQGAAETQNDKRKRHATIRRRSEETSQGQRSSSRQASEQAKITLVPSCLKTLSDRNTCMVNCSSRFAYPASSQATQAT